MLGALSAPAEAARPYEHLHIRDGFSESGEECGIPVEYETTFSLHILVRPVRGSDGQAFLGMENVRATTVVTNPVNGRWFTVVRSGANKEVRATHIGGDIWAFTLQETGVLFRILDSDGKVVLQDRGRLVRRGVFDTLGDGQPGGILLAEELLSLSGKFPAFDEEAACTAISSLLG